MQKISVILVGVLIMIVSEAKAATAVADQRRTIMQNLGSRATTGETVTITDDPAATAIPDAGLTRTFSSSDVNVPTRIKKITAAITVTHTFWSDLSITLAHGGATSSLMTRNGGSISSGPIIITFNDASGTPIAGFTGTAGSFAPATPLSVFAASSATAPLTTATDVRGNYVLTFTDAVLGLTGTYDKCELTIQTWNFVALSRFALNFFFSGSRLSVEP